MLNFSIIVPVYNRPDEVKDLLESLNEQTFSDFEIIIVEDGSTTTCEQIVTAYKDKLNIKYFFKDNSGPGTTRNYGAERASGNYFIFFDSDCIIPSQYMEALQNFLSVNYVDAYGGPDAAHPSFSNLQKAINYSMTSFFTTGGIRGGKERMDKFHPRSFNMGFSKTVFDKTKGFSTMRFGEDVDMSLRIIENNFTTALAKKCFVYHKRRSDFKKFYKQVFNSGIARINLYKRHPQSLKAVHLLPACFTIGTIGLVLLTLWSYLFILPLIIFASLIFIDSTIRNKNLHVGFLSVGASFVQLMGYGLGFIKSFWRRIILKKPEFEAFKKNFYK